jgi:dolichol kinase
MGLRPKPKPADLTAGKEATGCLKRAEMLRKLLHLGALAIPFGIAWLPRQHAIAFLLPLAAAILTGVLELAPLRVNDNFAVPLVCGLILQTWTGW